MKKKIFVIHAMSNIHCGTGQGVEDIDLPTAKEAATGFPIVPGSTVKGVLRDYYENALGEEKNKLWAAFGPDFENQTGNEYASALMITDAKILFMPVRSFNGVFAYVTSPMILERLYRDLKQVFPGLNFSIPKVEDNQSMATQNCKNLVNDHILLEDLELEATKDEGWDKWAAYLAGLTLPDCDSDDVRDRMILVSDNVFRFLCDTALPVIARIKIDQNTGTVQDGALWYEESLPAETILWGITGAVDAYNKIICNAEEILSCFAEEKLTLQFGGNATTGQGICDLTFIPSENRHE